MDTVEVLPDEMQYNEDIFTGQAPQRGSSYLNIGGPCENRTHDQRIKYVNNINNLQQYDVITCKNNKENKPLFYPIIWFFSMIFFIMETFRRHF